ncbi:related to TRZ1 - tRNase Z, involved in RNA processing [Melanopsichium pennsylvanicum]|uniref:ribonuclease Z n=2 Tax=Melanopsichium pennsylvanicum TaxID=63383 RepID=A0AAJ4XP36_9BASI|nr:related to TRZ1-tRNase Z, involved in RNA processing [Melanopsichium pennsylvanicum 4]SNX85356.1 related to TRZ1 - tRNase Z, involved in RNA processing [Melanopsichium pennsylvanicum]
MLADLRVLHVPSSDTNVLPPVILQLGADRYLFNVGEGTSRSSTQRRANLSRVSNIFVSRVGWEAIGGLPGVLMSMADGQRPAESLHGPDGLRYALATMRTYAKRDIMKLNINEISTHAEPRTNDSKKAISAASADSEADAAPIFSDDNLAIYAVTLLPANASQRASKKPRLDNKRTAAPSAATIEKIDQLWRKPYFNPSGLQGEDAQAWIQLVSDNIFNDSLLRKRQQQPVSNASGSNETIPSIEGVEMKDNDTLQPPSSSHSPAHSPWRPPLSPAFVTRLLPPPQKDTRNLSADRSDPAEGGQAPVLAYICEAHPQRGKFDPVKATEAGVPPGPSFAVLTKGQDIALKRPVSWSTMQADERKKWIQSQRNGQRGGGNKPKPNEKQKGKSTGHDVADSTPAAWNDLEEVLIKSIDVMGPSRAGAVVFHIYLPSIAYVDELLSDSVADSFLPYISAANRGLSREQSRTPHAIVHAVPLNVLQDARYQKWMRQFGPDCNHIIANYDVCANKLMFPSSATISLRLSKLDDVMFKVPQYQLMPRVTLAGLSGGTANGKGNAGESPLKLVAAEADQVVQLHPRGEPTRYNSGAPEFDWPVQSQEADKFAAFETEVVEDSEQQTQQLAKAKVKNTANSNAKPKKLGSAANTAEEARTDDIGAARNTRLREARKQAWSEYLDVVKTIKSNAAAPSSGVAPEQDILVTTLGTGSAAPSKYRNVISTLIQTPSSGNILLDAGESTYGLLRRKFGCRRDGTASESGSLIGQDVDDILREMRVLFISHIHADHHIGLIRLLLERRKLHPRPDKPLYLVGTGFVHNYLQEYERIEKVGLDEDIILVLNDHLDHRTGVDPNPTFCASEKLVTVAANGSGRVERVRREHLSHVESIKSLTGLSAIHTALVVHRGSHCYGLVIRHATEDWSVTYSGDTRPAPELIAAGRDCTLLIHEATLEDSELEMAIGKGHSTFGEAIRVGHEMGAKNILLTHFSQRYPKMARSSLFALNEGEKGGGNVPIALAFDLVTYPLSRFGKIRGYTPAMEALFAADMEGDEDAQSFLGGMLVKGSGTGADDQASASGKVGGQEQKGKKQSSTGKNAKGSAVVAAASTLGVVATSNDEIMGGKVNPKSAKADIKRPNAEREKKGVGATMERYVRKGMKPLEWRYVGLRLCSPAGGSDLHTTILPTFVVELVQSAQNATLGNVGGAFNVDVLSTHPCAFPTTITSDGKQGWDAVLRVEVRHAQDLVTCLSILPAPVVQGISMRIKVVGPTTAIQSLQNLLV